MSNFWKNKTVLVTGSAGFIGSHFVEELIKKGAKVICLDSKSHLKKFFAKLKLQKNLTPLTLNLLDYQKLKKTLFLKKIDVIINCAALDGNSEFKTKFAAQILAVNTRITSNILNFAKERKIKNVVLLSSAEIYPLTSKSPIKEEDDYKKNFDQPENGYILSKRLTEILGKLYQKQFKLNVFLPRPTNAYGPRDKAERVIPQMIKKTLRGQVIEIWGSGTQVRSFIYVKDLVFAILKMVAVKKYHLLNIAAKESISILALAKLISGLNLRKPKIKLLREKPTGPKKRVPDITKLNSIIDFAPRSLEAGLKETIRWYKIKLKKDLY